MILLLITKISLTKFSIIVDVATFYGHMRIVSTIVHTFIYACDISECMIQNCLKQSIESLLMI